MPQHVRSSVHRGFAAVALVALVAACAPTAGDDALSVEASDSLAAADTTLTQHAKIFGYVYGDGNYFTDLPTLPVDARFASRRPEMVNDIVRLGCRAGYPVVLQGRSVNCASFAPLTGSGSVGELPSKATVEIRGFRWPHGASLDAFGLDELRAFFSATLTVEGSRGGLILDQYPGIPAGHYTAAAIDHKLDDIVQQLQRLGFASAHKTDGTGAACSSARLDCRRVMIDRAEGCGFNPGYGFSAVLYARVPGAVATGPNPDNDPRLFGPPPLCR